MKLVNGNVLEVEGDTGEKITASINADKASKMFWMFSNLYRNVLGSVIREYTSNMFDSHKEAGVTDAVVIKVSKDSAGNFIVFKDFGVGLSPDRVKDIFMNYLTSTKESDNDMIGCFGIGSKSGLAYQNSFIINTFFDGINYNYILHKGEQGIPTLEEVFQIPTTERNGTEIKLYIKPEDYTTWNSGNLKRELLKQLFYFDNVYFEGIEVENDYVIYEADTFKWRPSQNIFNSLHLCVGKVTYDLNFDELGIGSIIIPVALKIEIGEVQVTPSREDIIYSKESKELILKKIDEFKAELIRRYKVDHPDTDDLVTYYREIDNRCKLKFGNSFLDIDSFITKEEKPKFIPLRDTGIKFVPSSYNLFIQYYFLNVIKNGSFKENKWGKPDLLVPRNNESIYRMRDDEVSSLYKNRYISSLDSNSYILKKKQIELKVIKQCLKLEDYPRKEWRKIINVFDSIITKHILSISKAYRDMEPSKEWITKWKEANTTKKKLSSEITTVNVCSKNGTFSYYDLDLFKVKEFIVLGKKDDADKIAHISQMFKFERDNFNKKTKLREKIVVFGIVSEQNFKKLKRKGLKFKTYEDIMAEFPKTLRRICTAKKISLVLGEILNDLEIRNLNSKIADDIDELNDFISNSNLNSIGELDGLLDYAEEKGYLLQEELVIMNRVREWLDKVPLLPYIRLESDNSDYHLVINYCKQNKAKLDFKHYQKEEKELQTETITENKEELIQINED